MNAVPAFAALAAVGLNRAEWPSLMDEALWNWPRRAAATSAADLVSLCEPLAGSLPAADPVGQGTFTDDDVPQALTLYFVYGIALLELSERAAAPREGPTERPELLQRAVHCLGHALSLARRHTPERVVPIKTQLYRAEHALIERSLALPA